MNPPAYRSEAQKENEGCRLKKTFNTLKEAQQFNSGLKTYNCRYCRKYHLASYKKQKG